MCANCGPPAAAAYAEGYAIAGRIPPRRTASPRASIRALHPSPSHARVSRLAGARHRRAERAERLLREAKESPEPATTGARTDGQIRNLPCGDHPQYLARPGVRGTSTVPSGCDAAIRRRWPPSVTCARLRGACATSEPARMPTDGGLEARLGTVALARVAAWSAAGDGHLMIARSLRPVPRTSASVLHAA